MPSVISVDESRGHPCAIMRTAIDNSPCPEVPPRERYRVERRIVWRNSFRPDIVGRKYRFETVPDHLGNAIEVFPRTVLPLLHICFSSRSDSRFLIVCLLSACFLPFAVAISSLANPLSLMNSLVHTTARPASMSLLMRVSSFLFRSNFLGLSGSWLLCAASLLSKYQ